MAYKITVLVAYEWKCAGEPCISVVSSLSLKGSSAEKRARRKPARAILYSHGRCSPSRSHPVWFLGRSVCPVSQNSMSAGRQQKIHCYSLRRSSLPPLRSLECWCGFGHVFCRERWGSMLFFAPPQYLESVPTCAMLQEIQMEAFTPPNLSFVGLVVMVGLWFNDT